VSSLWLFTVHRERSGEGTLYSHVVVQTQSYGTVYRTRHCAHLAKHFPTRHTSPSRGTMLRKWAMAISRTAGGRSGPRAHRARQRAPYEAAWHPQRPYFRPVSGRTPGARSRAGAPPGAGGPRWRALRGRRTAERRATATVSPARRGAFVPRGRRAVRTPLKVDLVALNERLHLRGHRRRRLQRLGRGE